jgi:gentisate 1,2-dioxygenase
VAHATALHPEAEAELAALDRELAEFNMEGHWHVPAAAVERAPNPVAKAHLWHWADIRRLLTAAGECRAIEGGAGRRTVRLCTPGLGMKWATPTIHTSIQLVKPGEIAEAHRHTMTAFRFVIEGHGGYTTVDGEKLRMEPGDMVLTPHSAWHDHGHEGGPPMIWIDGHDFPFVHHLNALFFETYARRQQEIVHDDDFARRSTGGLRPRGLVSPPAGPTYIYKGAEARALLAELGPEAHDPHHGITLEYVNPLTGGSMLPTFACRLHRLAAGEQTRRHRRTPSSIYHVVAGTGTTVAGDERLDWSAGDMFVVPGWTWQQHRAAGEAILLNISDEPIYRAFALDRTEDAA